MIQEVLNTFILEDRPEEAELTKRAVLKFAPNAMFTVAENEAEFQEKIKWGHYDIMLADYHLPAYNGLEALLYIKEHFPKLPFVFVTGALSSEVKVADAILEGANGYVLKEQYENLEPTVKRALAEAKKKTEEVRRAAKKESNRLLQLQKAIDLLDKSPDFANRSIIIDSLRKVQDIE